MRYTLGKINIDFCSNSLQLLKKKKKKIDKLPLEDLNFEMEIVAVIQRHPMDKECTRRRINFIER